LVTAQTEDSELALKICAASDKALAVLENCSLPTPEPVNIEAVETIPEDCVALYHCGENRVEVLAPDRLAKHRNPDGLFTDLTDEALFDALIAHEMAHAAYETPPCPFFDCRVTSEYVAYSMQIMSLSAVDRAAVEARIAMDENVSFDELNVILLFMAPHTFTAKAWAHLNQRPDACAYMGQIADGLIRFDNDIR